MVDYREMTSMYILFIVYTDFQVVCSIQSFFRKTLMHSAKNKFCFFGVFLDKLSNTHKFRFHMSGNRDTARTRIPLDLSPYSDISRTVPPSNLDIFSFCPSTHLTQEEETLMGFFDLIENG